MQRFSLTLAAARLAIAASLLGLAACNPVFNWREARPEGTALSSLLPCKPDKAEKRVPLAGRPVALRLLGCDVGDATFAIAVADVGDVSKVAATLVQWQSATLANMKAPLVGQLSGQPGGASDKGASEVVFLKLPGAASQPPAVLVKATGQRADGTAVSGQAAYFVQGSQVFQAVIYATTIKPEVAETFFSSLKFE
jgi:hypothetical protein